MNGLLAPLSLGEEATLRLIGFGGKGPLDGIHVGRPLRLELIEWSGWAWILTAVGRRHCDTLVVEASPARPAA